jgi:hypothetical protein
LVLGARDDEGFLVEVEDCGKEEFFIGDDDFLFGHDGHAQ